MANKNLSKEQIKHYLEMFVALGEVGLHNKLVGLGILKFASGVKEPEIELLDISDNFFILFKKNKEENFFILGKIFRRSAHTLSRQLKKDTSKNSRFLNMIKS